MYTITKEEAAKWIKAHNVGTVSIFINSSPPEQYLRLFDFVESLLKILKSHCGMLLLTDWPLYLPYQMTMIEMIRKGNGENRRLIDSPGHIIENEDSDKLLCLICLVVIFRWDATFYPTDNSFQLILNHHELIFLNFTDSARDMATDVTELIKNYNLKFEVGG